ncbi:hypothetical protein E2C01_008126 [Portunus trituberculatus]|uniref:Uncharacterized protein n=1 Tax=Portunus trituberculatus TaxID=210409 RepID=A0A5B7D0Y3_PORTR|nr:hypothetical protein [Portunus trituberculatus]
METEGAHCLRAALDTGKPVSIGEITRIVKTSLAKMNDREVGDNCKVPLGGSYKNQAQEKF